MRDNPVGPCVPYLYPSFQSFIITGRPSPTGGLTFCHSGAFCLTELQKATIFLSFISLSAGKSRRFLCIDCSAPVLLTNYVQSFLQTS